MIRSDNSLCSVFFTDDSHILLGGLHIAIVLLGMYRNRMAPIQARGGREVDSDLALSDRAVVGTAVKPNTPLRVCRMVAGPHQYRQRTHAESGFGQPWLSSNVGGRRTRRAEGELRAHGAKKTWTWSAFRQVATKPARVVLP